MKQGTAFTVLALLLGASPFAHGQDPVVTTALGAIEGRSIGGDPGVDAFLGIPFASPPTGVARWKPPQPVSPWQGVLEAKRYGPACPQPSLRQRSLLIRKEDEDCLTLNVWTPSVRKEPLPVMVWIHGGGMVTGSGSLPIYAGDELARLGAVVVTINYRLGPFGFLAHPALSAESEKKVSGNYGLLDQIAALRWVRDHIAAFGGDPGCVTIFGESAGAVSVSWLLAMPEARGLFHRAIAQSGTPGLAAPLESAEKAGAASATKLGIASGLDGAAAAAALRGIEAKELVRVLKPTIFAGQGTRFLPVVDGVFAPRPPMDAYKAGEFARVPVMIGSNSGDGSVFMRSVAALPDLAISALLKSRLEDKADRAFEIYGLGDGKVSQEARLQILTDLTFVAPARMMARALSSHEAPVFLYHFTYPMGAGFSESIGPARGKAGHGFEIPFVFGLPKFAETWSSDAADLSRTMMAAWVRFARTGDPALEGSLEWPRYDAATDRHLEFGKSVIVGSGLRKDACDLIEGLRPEALLPVR